MRYSLQASISPLISPAHPMSLTTLLIPPGPDFWSTVARRLRDPVADAGLAAGDADMSPLRVLVPGVAHIGLLRRALVAEMPARFLPPRISTLPAWLALQAPTPAASESARMMALYAELRQHGWLKKMFSARRNTDLLPLAQTLIALFDELSVALLPTLHDSPDAAEARWRAALATLEPGLAPGVRHLLSEEAQLVWTLWKSQLDAADPAAQRLAALRALAAQSDAPLVWIGMHAPDPLQQDFLAAYGARRAVLQITPDWQAAAQASLFASAWPEIVEGVPAYAGDAGVEALPCRLSLYRAASLEDEACAGAHTVLGWLEQGCESVAIIAQDRVVARRMRALLERAQVYVADETGWKLSTTRSAAALVALLETAATRGDTVTLLDLLKSPFAFAAEPERTTHILDIEHALRRNNVVGGWDSARAALDRHARPGARQMLKTVAEQAARLGGRRSLGRWSETTLGALEQLGMRRALQDDHAGRQVVALLESIGAEDQDREEGGQRSGVHEFSFSEWRAFLSLQLETTPFVPATVERRVVMLQLAGAPLRRFDAVLMVGADADHLPSQPAELLFFAGAVRRELGLATREQRQRLQLREFAELLSANQRVVLSWQQQRNGEPNGVSPWIERLELARAQAGLPALPAHHCILPEQRLPALPVHPPAPSAPQLLPQKLSASAWNSLVACPYQFFATRMLGLHGLDELSDMPEKRDYGEWLHRILYRYHETVRDAGTPAAERESLLRSISAEVFEAALAQSGAALAWYARWQRVLPAYLDWANAREAEGWRFLRGEEWLETRLAWSGGAVTLVGRIDRIDENEAGERAVLDYKTRNLTSLRAKLKEGEDHQLAFYGLLSDQPPAHAHYVALEASGGKTGDAAATDFKTWQQALRVSMAGNLEAVATGAALPASGIEKICTYCDVRGLCRKGAW